MFYTITRCGEDRWILELFLISGRTTQRLSKVTGSWLFVDYMRRAGIRLFARYHDFCWGPCSVNWDEHMPHIRRSYLRAVGRAKRKVERQRIEAQA